MSPLTHTPAPVRTPLDLRLVRRLRAIALRGLARMYLPQERMFCFCIRRGPAGDVPEGRSRRYTAIALLGLAGEAAPVVEQVLGGGSATTVGARLLCDVAEVDNLGDVALTLWAAQRAGLAGRAAAFERLGQLDPVQRPYPTVELAWTLTALAVNEDLAEAAPLRDAVAQRLLSVFAPRAGLFRHTVGHAATLRKHVACFADIVYPIQSLAYYYRATGNVAALEAAQRCAAVACELQGWAGQWWWHYDVRVGAVIERYPVYSVHQDAMAPMALLALAEAGGTDHQAAIRSGLQWLEHSPELLGGTLIDDAAGLIWRKVARREPRKLTRRLQAVASAVHPALRVPGVSAIFPPVAVDWESRPYHLGWILHAWSPARLAAWGGTELGA